MNQPVAKDSSFQAVPEEDLLRRSFDQLQTALGAGLIATWFWDVTQDKLYGDSNLLNLFGVDLTAGSAGLPLHIFTEAIHPEDRPRVLDLIDKARQSAQTFEADYRIGTSQFTKKWVFARGQFTYQQQQAVNFSGILVDVTDRKLIELRSQIAEDQLQLSIEAAQLGTWDFNLLTGELLFSDRAKQLFWLPLSAHVDYAVFLQTLHPDDREPTDRVVQAVLQPGSSGHYHCEYRAVGPDAGQLRWIRSNGQVFFNEHGLAYRFIGTVIDITAAKENETLLQQRVEEQTQELTRQAHQLRTTLDASLNSIIAMTAIRDPDGTIVDFRMDTANKAVVQSLFKTPEELIGQTLLTLFPGNKDNGFFDFYAGVVNTGQSGQTTQYYIDSVGLEGWFEVSAVKQDGDSVVITFNNITDRKRNELVAQEQASELKAANAELKRSNESLQQFAHIASHDLQEPLRRIQSFSDLLQSQFADNLSDGEKDMVRRIQRSAGRMQLLIKDLLFYSQLSIRQEAFVVVSLTDVLTDVLSDLELSITEKQATVSVAPLPSILGNASRLRQLFQNLLANALKFAPAGTAPLIKIDSVAAQPDALPQSLQDNSDQTFWLITVADNGIGFDVRYKDRIFTPFQRLHSPVNYSGTGIGLAICQRVAQNHGGIIDVDSQVGRGSVFKVFLPALSNTHP